MKLGVSSENVYTARKTVMVLTSGGISGILGSIGRGPPRAVRTGSLRVEDGPLPSYARATII